MKNKIILFSIIAIFLSMTSGWQYAQDYHWYKGNTHCHTTYSDGDELPRRVMRWYKDHEYNFVAITDHDYYTDITHLDTDRNDNFILIPGLEVTDSFGKAKLHVNGLNVRTTLLPRGGKNIVETLQNDIDLINEAGGIAQINHPSWKWSINEEHMAQLKDVFLFEVYNINVDSNNFGAGGYPGTEEIWDRLLSRNIKMYGVASDDTHTYTGEFSFEKSIPGKGWIMVRAKELTVEAIIDALKQGDFYASTGVELLDVKITNDEYRVEIKPDTYLKYTTFFIGKDGKILKEDHNPTAIYRFKGDELYVRARVFCTSGALAVTQPYFLKK
jgi:hypothetical protein